MADDFDEGLLVGLLVGEGHFGGDGRQAQVTLRMHVRHESMFLWIQRSFPGGKLYGPYSHGGRDYFQWMARGPFLRDVLTPLLRRRLSPAVDKYAFGRFEEMRSRYEGPVPDKEGESGHAPTDATTDTPDRSQRLEHPATAAADLDAIFDRLRRSQPE